MNLGETTGVHERAQRKKTKRENDVTTFYVQKLKHFYEKYKMKF